MIAVIQHINKLQRKAKGQPRMNIPETLAALGTQKSGRRKKTRKLKRCVTRTTPKPGGDDPTSSRRASISYFVQENPPCYSY